SHSYGPSLPTKSLPVSSDFVCEFLTQDTSVPLQCGCIEHLLAALGMGQAQFDFFPLCAFTFAPIGAGLCWVYRGHHAAIDFGDEDLVVGHLVGQALRLAMFASCSLHQICMISVTSL
ncbi:MAG: hypothetical protein FWG56_04545, partial [Desulfovibrionaceae bacterium]|nr:hypothetical protein [Desulfovibrionaceae bacterium]